MPRVADETIRAELLEAIVERVFAGGLAELTLRPLGAAVGVSPRTLLYHFGSKEALIGAILEAARARQRTLLAAWYERSAEHDARTMLLRSWQWLAAPRQERVFRVLFEAYGLGLNDRKRYGAFLRATSLDWLGPFTKILEDHGFDHERAVALATRGVAVVRGLLLDVLATGDRSRAERAFRSFINAIELPAGNGPLSV